MENDITSLSLASFACNSSVLSSRTSPSLPYFFADPLAGLLHLHVFLLLCGRLRSTWLAFLGERKR